MCEIRLKTNKTINFAKIKIETIILSNKFPVQKPAGIEKLQT